MSEIFEMFGGADLSTIQEGKVSQKETLQRSIRWRRQHSRSYRALTKIRTRRGEPSCWRREWIHPTIPEDLVGLPGWTEPVMNLPPIDDSNDDFDHRDGPVDDPAYTVDFVNCAVHAYDNTGSFQNITKM